MTGSTKSMDGEVFNARSNGQDVPARDRRELCQGLTKPFGPDPLHHLLDLHDSLGLGIGCWLAVEPPADRMDTCPTDPPGIPGLSRLHSRRLADRCGRRDHRARVPAAQGMGVRGSVFPLLGCGGVAPAGRRLVSYQHVVYSASVFDVRHGVVGAEASRPSAPGYRTRAGNTSSRVGGSDWHPPSVVNRFVSDAPLG